MIGGEEMAVSAVLVEADKPKEAFYPPGWVDRLTDWVDTLRIPAWAFYLLVWIILFAIETAVNWYTGVYPVGTIFPYHLIFTGIVVYTTAMIHYLDSVTRHSLKSFRPALIGDDADFARLEHKLTTMPARSTLLATIGGLLLGVPIALVIADDRTRSLTKLLDSVPSMVLNMTLLAIIWTMMGVFAFHTARQLYLVSRIYSTACHVDLFRRGPLYAFSGLAARTAFALAILPYAGIITRPAVTENVAIVWAAISVNIAGLLIFVWPLLGMHRLMEAEKKRLLDQNGQKMEAAINETHRRLDAQDLTGMENLKDALDNLVTEQTVVSKISTWPWQLGTVSVLATALFLPIILWVVQRLLDRLLGF
jgi:hypothetical protein